MSREAHDQYQYDFIIVGAGAAGLSLALQLVRSPLHDRSILIVDKADQERNDRTWSFWTNRPTLFDEIACGSWDQLRWVEPSFEQVIDLQNYQYRMIRAIDFSQFAREQLAAYPNVRFVKGRVNQIEDEPGVACVAIEGQTFHGRWVFDSRSKLMATERDPVHYHYLKMHFKAWEIETPAPAFEPQAVTFLDFRTPQPGALCFFYVLPLSERRALIEYTVFSRSVLKRREYEQALQAYVETTLGIRAYHLLGEEGGAVLITDQPFPRRVGQHILNIGVRGGRIKPSTGFAFTRIQQDSAAIVQSLLEHGQPFDLPADSRRYRLFDSMMLEIMQRHGDRVSTIFGMMFKRNPIERVLRFLDEAGSFGENVRLILTLGQKGFFLKVLLRVCFNSVARQLAMKHRTLSVR